MSRPVLAVKAPINRRHRVETTIATDSLWMKASFKINSAIPVQEMAAWLHCLIQACSCIRIPWTPEDLQDNSIDHNPALLMYDLYDIGKHSTGPCVDTVRLYFRTPELIITKAESKHAFEFLLTEVFRIIGSGRQYYSKLSVMHHEGFGDLVNSVTRQAISRFTVAADTLYYETMTPEQKRRTNTIMIMYFTPSEIVSREIYGCTLTNDEKMLIVVFKYKDRDLFREKRRECNQWLQTILDFIYID